MLSDLLRQPNTLLVFYLPGCTDCVTEFEQLGRTLDDERDWSSFILVSPGNPRLAEDERDEYGLRCPILYDHRAAFTRDKLSIHAFPFNVLVDRNRTVMDITIGPLDQSDFLKIISSDSEA